MSDKPVLLYVEDEPLSRQVMQILVNAIWGLEQLTVFEDSRDFLTCLEALSPPPDIILLDIHMKPYNGFELLEMIRNHEVYHDTVVVAVTASVMNEEVDLLKQAGFDGGISKPIDQNYFPTFIHHVMQGEEIWYVT